MEEIKLLPEEWSVFTDYYEYEPRLYSLEQIDCAELTANNCLEQFSEDMEEFIRQVNREWGEKLRATDTDHIFNIICHGIWDRITEVQKYYFNECDKTRTKILEMMEEEQSGSRREE